MKKETLQKLTIEQLQKKEKGHKTLIGIFIPLILALFFFVIRDYFKGDEVDASILTIAICSVGGFVALLPELKMIQTELKERENKA